MKPRMARFALAASAALLAAGCQPRAPTASEAGPAPIASIQELMDQQVDPAADRLWGAVGEKIDASGYTKLEPRTPEEWAELRMAALDLAEAPNLLVVPGRPVAVKGGKIADEGSPGVLTTLQVQARIEDEPARFQAAAARLQKEALGMIAAIDAKSPDQLADAGERVDGACESCHQQFWYPPGQAPKSVPIPKKP